MGWTLRLPQGRDGKAAHLARQTHRRSAATQLAAYYKKQRLKTAGGQGFAGRLRWNCPCGRRCVSACPSMGMNGRAQRREPWPPSQPIGGANVKPIGVRETSPSTQYLETAGRHGQLLAGCCPPPRSPVRPPYNALRAFNAQWPWAPCESGLTGRHEWLEARRGRR